MKNKGQSKKRKGLRGLLAVMLLAICVCIGQEVLAAQKRTVKVAFFPMDGYHNVLEDGSFGGMDVEYLKVL